MIHIDFFLKPKELIINKSCSITLSMSVCSCCKQKIKRSKRVSFKKVSIAICTYCRNYYRKHCLFFGNRCKNSDRYKFCHKFMCDDKMICKKIPDWIIKALSRDKLTNKLENDYYYPVDLFLKFLVFEIFAT